MGASKQFAKPNTAYVALMDARRMDAYVGIYGTEMEAIKSPYFCTLTPTSFDFC